jgi:hypothetical protein
MSYTLSAAVQSGESKSRCGGLLEVQQLEQRRLPDSLVQFLHQTAKKYLDDKSTWSSIFGNVQHPRSDVYVAFLSTCLCHLKQRRTKISLDDAMISRATVLNWQSWENIVWKGLLAGKESEERLGKSPTTLLDEIDRVVQATANIQVAKCAISNGTDKSTRFFYHDPTSLEFPYISSAGGYRSFLSFAVEAGLHLYVDAKIQPHNLSSQEISGIWKWCWYDFFFANIIHTYGHGYPRCCHKQLSPFLWSAAKALLFKNPLQKEQRKK